MKNIVKKTFADDDFSMEVNVSFEEETVWMSNADMCQLYDKNKSTISRHINQVLKQKEETDFESVVAENATEIPKNATEVVKNATKVSDQIYYTYFYNLDVIIEVGNRIKSSRTKPFYDWAISLFNNQNKQIESNIIKFNQGEISLDVNVSVEENTVWLSQAQLAILFETTTQNISAHIINIYDSGELDMRATLKDFLIVQIENGREVSRLTHFYNLDMIISLGYRVNTKNGIMFRKWATNILREYIATGFSINEEKVTVNEKYFVRLENRMTKIENKMTELENRTLYEPIKDKLFLNGQYFDSYELFCDLVGKAKDEVIFIDPYFDYKGLNVLSKRQINVFVIVCHSTKARLRDSDIELFKEQNGGNIEILVSDKFHNRFIILDRKECYDIGTSVNYAGKGGAFLVHKVEEKVIVDHLVDIIMKIREESKTQ